MESEYSISNNSTTIESITENLIFEDIQNINMEDIISYISNYFIKIIKLNRQNKNRKKEKENDDFYSNRIPVLTIEKYLKRIIKYTQMEKSTLIISFIYILHIIEKENYFICKNNIYRIIIASCIIASKFNEETHYKNSHFAKIGGLNLNEINFLEYSILSKINFELYVNEGEFYFIIDKIIKNEKKI